MRLECGFHAVSTAPFLGDLAHGNPMGTVWDPWEESLCVFGPALLAEAEQALTGVLGTVMRRGGRNVGNVWTYESEGYGAAGHPPRGCRPGG